MITSIFIILLAFAWLMYETNFLRVRLTGYDNTLEYTNQLDAEVQEMLEKPEIDILEPVKKSDSAYTPTEFIPLDLPELTGTLNVKSFRICESEYERVA